MSLIYMCNFKMSWFSYKQAMIALPSMVAPLISVHLVLHVDRAMG